MIQLVDDLVDGTTTGLSVDHAKVVSRSQRHDPHRRIPNLQAPDRIDAAGPDGWKSSARWGRQDCMASKAETAETVEDYLSGLPDDRRVAIAEVRDTIVANLPDGIVETMAWGMVAYQVPLEVFPDTYNKKPLLYAALASQKNYMAVYLHSIYMNEGQAEWFKDAYIETGKKLDMGKSCVRFKKIEQLPVDLIGQAIARVTLDEFLGYYRAVKG